MFLIKLIKSYIYFEQVLNRRQEWDLLAFTLYFLELWYATQSTNFKTACGYSAFTKFFN